MDTSKRLGIGTRDTKVNSPVDHLKRAVVRIEALAAVAQLCAIVSG